MTKEWGYNQPLESKPVKPSDEERIRIAEMITTKPIKTVQEVDYAAAFAQEKQGKQPEVVPVRNIPKQEDKVTRGNITNDYKQHLADVVTQNHRDIALAKQKIEELHQLIDDRHQQNKKLQAISDAIDDL